MLNRQIYENTRPGSMAVLEISAREDEHGGGRQFVPLKRTVLRGEIAGPVAALRLVQTYAYSRAQCGQTLEALYRFPLPGDAAVTHVRVRFGEVEIETRLEPASRQSEYKQAVERGQASRTGDPRGARRVHPARGRHPARPRGGGRDLLCAAGAPTRGQAWLELRAPLTTAPRYVREDERGIASMHRASRWPWCAIPATALRSICSVRGAGEVCSPTHAIDLLAGAREGGRAAVRLHEER